MARTVQNAESKPKDDNRQGCSSHKAEPESKQITFSTSSSGSLHNYCLAGFGNRCKPVTVVCFTCFPFVNVSLYCSYLIPIPLLILVVEWGRQLGKL